MEIYLLRHGETDWNRARRLQGQTDIALNETGVGQARLLGKQLQNKQGLTCIYTSPLQRARETAAILSAYLKLPVREEAGLQELSFGRWEGMSWEEIEEKYPEALLRWQENRRLSRDHQGESYEDVLRRVLPTLREIALMQKGRGDALAVTHGGVLYALRAYYLGEGDFGSYKNPMPNCGELLAVGEKDLFKTEEI